MQTGSESSKAAHTSHFKIHPPLEHGCSSLSDDFTEIITFSFLLVFKVYQSNPYLYTLWQCFPNQGAMDPLVDHAVSCPAFPFGFNGAKWNNIA